MVLAHNINEGLRTQDVQISGDVTFDTMLLTPNTLEGLTYCGFYKPSPIQLHGIPLGKCGFDLLLEAKSGTGKTAVFTVIALEKLDLAKGLQTIILAPTREIAAQICDVITQIGSNYKSLNVEVVIGGLPVHEDITKFKQKVHIVVGSPGRLRHLIQANHIDVSAVRLLVLDEADKLMDKSFQADINYIFSVLPKEKQVIMSSATYPEILNSVINKYVHNAQHICPDSTTVLLGIKQLVTTVKSNSNIVRQTQNRFEELLKILSKKEFKQCLIFCNYQVRVRDLCRMLMREKWPAEQLHGQQEQTDRLDALRTLQEYKCRILISTDLAARGIDASNVDLVINFEPPYDWQTYLHRIGRAGRFGSYGTAITILSEGQEELKFKKMIKAINSSLTLKNLWDEEKFDLDNCEPSLDTGVFQEIDSNYAYNELINKLTHRDIKHAEEVESFENLCESFKINKETEIESFDDLLTCFKSHKLDDYNSSSNTFYKESNNECSSILNIKNNELLILHINKELEESLMELKDTIKITNKSLDKKSEEELGINNNTQEKHLEPQSIQKIPLNKATNTNGTHSQKQNIFLDVKLDLEFDESHMNKALLDAGLPTSFSSLKSCLRKPNKLHNTGLNDNENIDNTQEPRDMKHKETRNKHTAKGIKTYNKLEPENCLLSECETDSSVKHNNSKTLKDKKNKLRENYNKKNYNQDTYIRKDTQIHDHEVETNWDIYTKYTIWYNQLKSHIEHIQMSLYIDDLSKM